MRNAATIVCRSLSKAAICADLGEHVAFATHCLYPSNKAVTVYISGGANECVVSDYGGAVDEISTAGLSIPDTNKMLRQFCRPVGLNVSHGQIVSPPVPITACMSAVVAVANASRDAAMWGVANLKPRRKRNLVAEISNILGRHFAADKIRASEAITGASNRRYEIDWVIPLSSTRKLLIDSVLPEPNSVNAKAVAHMDIHGSNGKDQATLVSLLAYDDDDEWKSSDLRLLQMAGKLTPISSMDRTIEQLAS
jgi:hypothetical protein